MTSNLREEPAASYSYSPIQKSEIRLLRIHFGSDGSVRGHLRAFPLSNPQCPKYIALSYVWGEPAFSWSIVVDGCHLPILRSLQPFMDMLRTQNERWVDTWWWIDAICINVKNLQRAQYSGSADGKNLRQCARDR